jgi:hypothetical protein
VEPSPEQEFDRMTPDETGAARYQDRFDSRFLSKSQGFVDFSRLLKYIQKSLD